MSLVQYPVSLPLPLQADYSYSIAPNVKRSTMSDGWVRQRKVTSCTPNTVNVSFMYDEDEYIAFLKFYVQDINEGADWFLLRLTTPVTDENNTGSIELIERAVRFQAGKISTKLNFFDGRYCWKVTAVLDIDVNLPLESAAAGADWDTDTPYNLEILFNGGAPVIRGKKRCYKASKELPTGSDDLEPGIIIDSDLAKIGMDFYTEALTLNTTDTKILEVQSEYTGLDSYTSSNYYLGRVRNTDQGNGLGLTATRNTVSNQGEYVNALSFKGISKSGGTVSYSYRTPQITQIALPIGTPIKRRDIWINDAANNLCTYYVILNGKTAAKVEYTACIEFSACLYQIGDRQNNGSGQNIKLTALRAANYLIEGLPDD